MFFVVKPTKLTDFSEQLITQWQQIVLSKDIDATGSEHLYNMFTSGRISVLVTLLLTWFNFNPSMDK